MTTKSDPIVISDDEDNGQDDEILSIGSSDGSIELIEERPPPPTPPFRTAQEKAAARFTTRLKPLSTFNEYRGPPPSGSRHSKTPRQPNINGQLPTPERSPPRPLPRSSQQFLVETSPIHSSISERTSSTRPNKRSYGLEDGRGASAESNSRKRPRNNALQSTLPSRPVDIIVIDDDDDVQEVQPLCSETSDESDWDLYHAGFVWPTLPSSVLNAPKPSEPDPNEIDHTLLRLQRLRLATDEAPVGCEVMHSSSVSKPNSWSQTRRIKLSTRRVVASNWDGAEARLQLITTPGLLAAPGSVCKIDQSGPAVAFASTAIGGGIDAWDADQRSANRAGALLYWQQSDPSNILIPQQRTGNEWSVWEDPECHFRDNQAIRYRLHNNREQEATIRVYYTVTDVKFNPLRPDVFVSSSFDKSIRTWSYDENQKRVRNTLDGYSYDYSAIPQFLDFRPNSQILAVGCSDGSSYIHAPGIEYPQKLPLSSKQRLEVTAQSWGPESTIASDYLICGGGAPSQDKVTANRGWASAWILRPDKAERVCNFIMGDTAGFYCNHLCVNPTGQYVAIASSDDELRFSAKNLVEFFDLRAKPRAIFRQYLPPSSAEDSDVLCSAFSPDGLYYACSREDNTAQVWDWRWMARNTKPLRMIEHQPPGRSGPRHTWGVPAMTWVAHDGPSSPPLLVTGGDDGKIIQWDMRRSDSCLLAELESGVGFFSIGDRQKGEMPLIAGDCDGKLYIYDSSRGALGHSASRLM